MRKDSDFEVMDRIKVGIKGNDRVASFAMANKDAIATKVLAEEITKDSEFAISKEWNINGEKTVISVEKV